MTPRTWLRHRLDSRRNGKRVRAYLDYVAAVDTQTERVIDLRTQEAEPAVRRA